MNWMIDGAHGDLYRQAMNYPKLAAATDEWEIERNLHRKPKARRALLAPVKAWTSASLGKLRGAFHHAPASHARPVTQWTLF